jgi:hypothetical protein
LDISFLEHDLHEAEVDDVLGRQAHEHHRPASFDQIWRLLHGMLASRGFNDLIHALTLRQYSDNIQNILLLALITREAPSFFAASSRFSIMSTTGKQLAAYALHTLNVLYVDVNE